MKINGAQLIIKLLEQHNIRYVTGIPGGANLPIYDALVDSSIEHILTRHEQGGGFVAQGMARVSGEVAVCMASSGPGATNLVTAVADAHLDSIPLIAITGQVPSNMLGTDAFQECDTFGLMLPITKHNWLVRSAAELLEVIPEAFRIAQSGRPGPVSIDVPKDVQQEVIEIDLLPDCLPKADIPVISGEKIDQFRDYLAQAKRPILMVGGGVIHSGHPDLLLQFAEQQSIPTVASFMGLGIIPADHPLSLGMLGMHGAQATNMALEECDLLIAAGVRFDDRATGKASEFCPQAKIVHIDIDRSEIGKIKQPTLGIKGDVCDAIEQLMARVEHNNRSAWITRIKDLKQNFGHGSSEGFSLNTPQGLMATLGDLCSSETNIITDVGQHQMWTAQLFPFQRARQWISSGGLGTMGFGLPAAIGAAFAQPDRMALCVSGDGSIMMNIQELETLAEHNLNVKIVVMNNNHLGMVRQQQKLFYRERFSGIHNRHRANFALIAQGMGIRGIDLGDAASPQQALADALASDGPCLINIPISEQEMVFPMVPPGAANRDMVVE
ncbi:biosynthetic-type acetolactate synthase large subunit [Pseudomonadota bacterium]